MKVGKPNKTFSKSLNRIKLNRFTTVLPIVVKQPKRGKNIRWSCQHRIKNPLLS